MNGQQQVFLRLPFVETLRVVSLPRETEDLLGALERIVPAADARFYWTVNGLRTPLDHGRSLLDFTCGQHAFPLSLTLHPRVLGGKGGFGTQLKSQAGRMARKRRGEKANIGSCRDLSGRRLKTLDEAQQYAYLNASIHVSHIHNAVLLRSLPRRRKGNRQGPMQKTSRLKRD